ncbi:MAG: methyltransferase domain-containing protein [Candidatus Melainabacteria bacterium]|nr:methyltransferase domain-containing protein [Candidatus Melainabacteria bacterium]
MSSHTCKSGFMDKAELAQALLPQEKPSLLQEAKAVALDFARSIGHSAIQTPLDGISQLVNYVKGKEVLPHVQLVEAPRQAQFGSANWHAQQIGGAVGLILPFGIVNKGIRSVGGLTGRLGRLVGLGKWLETPLAKSALPVLEAGTTGATFEGLLRPVQTEEGDFITARLHNATAGALTFGTLQATTMGLKGLSTAKHAAEQPWLISSTSRDLRRHLIAGGFAGIVDAEARSLLSGKGPADLTQLTQSAYGFMWVGGALRGSRYLADVARRRSTVADVVAGDSALQAIVTKSPTAKALVANLGEVRISKVPTDKAPVGPAKTTPWQVAITEPLISGQYLIQIPEAAFKAADPIERAQMLVKGLSDIEASVRNPLTLRHVLRESAYVGLMTSRQKGSMARELNFTKEIRLSQGEQSSRYIVEALAEHWADIAEGPGIHQKLSSEYQAKFGPWAKALGRLPLFRLITGRLKTNLKDKEHLLALREFDVKSQDEQARKAYLGDMGPAEKGTDKATNQDTGTSAETTAGKNEKLDRVIDLIPEGARVVVDMGAGGGQFSRALKVRRPGAEVVALDLSGQMVSELSTARQQTNIDYRIQHGDAMMPDFPPESIDVVTGNSHTHEVYSYPDIGHGHYSMRHLELMFARYGEMLRPGGRVLLQDFIVPRYGNYQGPFRIVFITPEGRAYFDSFMADLSKASHELGLDHTKPVPEMQRLPSTTDSPHGSIEASAKSLGEFLVSSMYGMRMKRFGWPLDELHEYQGVLMERFANLTPEGFIALAQRTAPAGFQMRPLRVSTYTSPDYIEHWTKHFQIETQGADRSWTPISDMSSFHTRAVMALEKIRLTRSACGSLLSPARRAFVPALPLPATLSLFNALSPYSLLSPPGQHLVLLPSVSGEHSTDSKVKSRQRQQ